MILQCKSMIMLIHVKFIEKVSNTINNDTDGCNTIHNAK